MKQRTYSFSSDFLQNFLENDFDNEEWELYDCTSRNIAMNPHLRRKWQRPILVQKQSQKEEEN